ncbi:MAG: sigma-70 family RNA polymerase sigma factor [Oscillospiraceae bacterium]|nr:sigma-70 family RNA polymerase sigma factor [Oscillospiraceae bacterium]
MENTMDNGASYYRRWLDGDESAFAGIIEEYRDPVTFFIQRYVHDICAAEDIAADVFMYLVVHPRKYNFKDSFKTFLFVIARSRALDYLRKRKRAAQVPLDEAEPFLSDETNLEEQAIRSEEKRKVNEALRRLPEDQQLAVHLVYFEEYSYADAARIMKKTRKQVDNLLYRAKNTLRDLIGKDGELAV